jgi:hypothetical protein
MGTEVRMSDFDFRFRFLDLLAIPGDPDHHRREEVLGDLQFVGGYNPPAALSACKGLVAALSALHQGASRGEVLSTPGTEPMDPATMLQGAAFLDEVRAMAWNASDWEVFALAFHLQDALERRVKPHIPDHELVLGVCR